MRTISGLHRARPARRRSRGGTCPSRVARGRPGATTVSATIWAAAPRRGRRSRRPAASAACIRARARDVSADLLELARTPGLLVCSGPKSIVDPVATAERLEELGVALVGYGVDRLPFFLAREAPVELDHRVDTPVEAARLAPCRVAARARRSTRPAVQPDPRRRRDGRRRGRPPRSRWRGGGGPRRRRAARRSRRSCSACLAELTGGRSLEANLALLEANARLAG